MIKVQGNYVFTKPIKEVWESLQSAEVLSDCIPGCENLSQNGESSYDVEIRIKIAAVTGKYTGNVTITDAAYPDTYTMTVRGKGSGGTIMARGVLTFGQDEIGTVVTVEGEAQASGMIARVGQRILGGAAKLLMNQFFQCLKEKLDG